MRADILGFNAKDIARWSEPLVADYIFAAYEQCSDGDAEAAGALTQAHCRLWRSLLAGETTIARYARRELIKAAHARKVNLATLDAIDSVVLEALLDVIMRRSQRSRTMARSEGMALVEAASTLGELRKVA